MPKGVFHRKPFLKPAHHEREVPLTKVIQNNHNHDSKNLRMVAASDEMLLEVVMKKFNGLDDEPRVQVEEVASYRE